MKPLIVAVALVQLTTPAGHQLFVNPAEVSSVREPAASSHWAKGVRCVVVMSNGRFNAVAEDCVTVWRKLKQEADFPGAIGKAPCTEVCGGERR